MKGSIMTDRVGFVGLGVMGRGMARNMLRAGQPLTVWNRTASRADELVAEGAIAASSPAEVARAAEVIVLCVSDTDVVEQVLLGDDGIATSAGPGTLVVDCSTISPIATRAFGAALAGHEIALVDAPISGGSEGAERGTLSVMAGGSDDDVARARAVLEPCSGSFTHVGELGAGQATKLVNQILVVGNMLAVSEALVFGAAMGLDLERTLEAVTGGAAGSWMLANRGPQVIARDWRPGFTIDLQLKDLRLIEEAAASCGAPVLTTALIRQLYTLLQADGLGEEGNHALVKAIERLAGVEASRGDGDDTPR
jgi:3-hydroxyisobutyrate dehydrogenase-like beta-hydroxyacid dehydrogenase